MSLREKILKIITGIIFIITALYAIIESHFFLNYQLTEARGFLQALSFVSYALSAAVGIFLICSKQIKHIGIMLLIGYSYGLVNFLLSFFYRISTIDSALVSNVCLSSIPLIIAQLFRIVFAVLCIHRERIKSKKLLWVVLYMLFGVSILSFIIEWGFSFGDKFSLINITYRMRGTQYISLISVLSTVCLSTFVAGTYETKKKSFLTVAIAVLYAITLSPVAFGFILDIMTKFRNPEISLQYVFLIFRSSGLIAIGLYALTFILTTILLIARLRMRWIKEETQDG